MALVRGDEAFGLIGFHAAPVHDNTDLHASTAAVEQLGRWNVDTNKTPYLCGPAVTCDPKAETVLGPDKATKLYKPNYRKEFAIPELA